MSKSERMDHWLHHSAIKRQGHERQRWQGKGKISQRKQQMQSETLNVQDLWSNATTGSEAFGKVKGDAEADQKTQQSSLSDNWQGKGKISQRKQQSKGDKYRSMEATQQQAEAFGKVKGDERLTKRNSRAA